MSGLGDLAQSLAGLSAASTALEAENIARLLEEQNYLLSQLLDQKESDSCQPESKPDLACPDLIKYAEDLLTKFDFSKNQFLASLACPLKPIDNTIISDLAKQTKEDLESSAWKWDLSANQKFLLSSVIGEVPSEPIQQLFYFLFVARGLYERGVHYAYSEVWDNIILPRTGEAQGFACAAECEALDLLVAFDFYGQSISQRLKGLEAWYFITLFSSLHYTASIDSAQRLSRIRAKGDSLTVEELHGILKGDSVDELLDYSIRTVIGFSVPELLSAKILETRDCDSELLPPPPPPPPPWF